MDVIFELLFFILAFGAVLFLLVITTKYIGGKAKKAAKGHYINIVETVALGLDKKIHLLKVGEEFVLIATSNKNIQFLTTLKLDEITDEAVISDNAFDFKSLFEKYVGNFKSNIEKRNKKNIGQNEENKNSGEGYVFRSNLDKLKDITSKMGKKNVLDGDDNTNEE